MSQLLFKLLHRAGAMGAAALDINLTSTLDSRITFTRAGTRTYLDNGVLTSLATGLPAFESWDGVNRGMAIEPGFTNLLTYSSDYSQAAWVKTAVTLSAGDAGAGLITSLTKSAATATSGYHYLQTIVSGVSAGVRQTFSAFVKTVSGAPYSVALYIAPRYENLGSAAYFRIDGNDGFSNGTGVGVSDLTSGMKNLGGGIYQVWVSGVWAGTGEKQFRIAATSNANPSEFNFSGAVSDAVQVFGAQVSNSNGPGGYVATNGVTASQAAESAIFNDTAWFNSTEGTFVIDHDCWTGTLLGSGTNSVVSATAAGRTAIAWSGATSDTVSNGGATSTGSNPTFFGSDIRLLATSAATNCGHIKRIRFYATRKSVAELQALTAPDTVSTSAPGSYRTVSPWNRLPAKTVATTGSNTTFSCRFQMDIGSHDVSEIKLDFPNWGIDGGPIGNAINIESCSLERETTVAEYAPVYVGGSRSFTIADGASTTVISDAILPSAFTGLTVFPVGLKMWVRLRGNVTTTGHKFPGCRFSVEVNARAVAHDSGTNYSAVDSTGPMVFVSGTAQASLTQGYCPIMIGKFVSGDPKTCFTIGDSIVEGVGGVVDTSFLRQAVRSLGTPTVEMSRGGASQTSQMVYFSTWSPYFAYARVLIDEMGTNAGSARLDFFGYWHPAKHTYNYDKIIKVGLFPYRLSYNNWQDEANQYGGKTAYLGGFVEQDFPTFLKYGWVDAHFDSQGIRGVDKSKYLTNGTSNYMTIDGTHPSATAHTVMQSEFEPILSALTVTT